MPLEACQYADYSGRGKSALRNLGSFLYPVYILRAQIQCGLLVSFMRAYLDFARNRVNAGVGDSGHCEYHVNCNRTWNAS